jgi:hypothetical protein
LYHRLVQLPAGVRGFSWAKVAPAPSVKNPKTSAVSTRRFIFFMNVLSFRFFFEFQRGKKRSNAENAVQKK